MAERYRWHSAGRIGWWLIVCVLLLTTLMLAACESSVSALPTPAGGIYTSTQYHFNVTYPAGWQVNVPPGQDSSATIPLMLLITRINTQTSPGEQSSSFTITVFNAHDPVAAAGIAALLKQAKAADSPLRQVTIAGKKGYQDKPAVQTVAGSQLTDTHTDYYLLTPGYEYQLTTDNVSADDATSTLQAMLASFTLLK